MREQKKGDIVQTSEFKKKEKKETDWLGKEKLLFCNSFLFLSLSLSRQSIGAMQ